MVRGGGLDDGLREWVSWLEVGVRVRIEWVERRIGGGVESVTEHIVISQLQLQSLTRLYSRPRSEVAIVGITLAPMGRERGWAGKSG